MTARQSPAIGKSKAAPDEALVSQSSQKGLAMAAVAMAKFVKMVIALGPVLKTRQMAAALIALGSSDRVVI